VSENRGKTVAEILRSKKASVKKAPLPEGSPSWESILEFTWEEVQKKAKRRVRGFKTIRKLLSDPEYNK
jgi:hypothetical protein